MVYHALRADRRTHIALSNHEAGWALGEPLLFTLLAILALLLLAVATPEGEWLLTAFVMLLKELGTSEVDDLVISSRRFNLLISQSVPLLPSPSLTLLALSLTTALFWLLWILLFLLASGTASGGRGTVTVVLGCHLELGRLLLLLLLLLLHGLEGLGREVTGELRTLGLRVGLTQLASVLSATALSLSTATPSASLPLASWVSTRLSATTATAFATLLSSSPSMPSRLSVEISLVLAALIVRLLAVSLLSVRGGGRLCLLLVGRSQVEILGVGSIVPT